ncbi:MAG: metallophosphoesterase, partial [Bullifex sp.]
MKKLTYFAIIMMVLISLTGCVTGKHASSRPAGEPYELVIIATSDLHANPWGFSYEDGKETTNNGMARLYSFISKEREAHPDLILIDGGDDIQGTILSDDLANKDERKEHPIVEAMNFMGYDAMTLGNHEFNWGISVMKDILSGADFPVLAANVRDAKGRYVTGAGHTIIDRAGVKVAVIGVVTPDVPIWDGGKEGISDYIFQAASDAVKAEIALVKDKADIIVVS